MEWYPWYPLDFRRDTLNLSFAEDGAYRRLIDEYMILRGPLPDDDAALARLLGVGISEWLSVASVVRGFFRARDGVLIHKRCDREIDAQIRRNERFSKRGKKAAFAKYSRANGLPARRMLVPATLHNKDNILTSQSVLAKPQEASEEARGGEVSELAAIVRAKGWAR
jgi:uncharacterized protein YdaU (DUF1376 family)